jgi:Na+-transporting NADH:ubiquinone oxidoreductase subunit A
MTGAFEKVTPMDIFPTHLLKAILAEDYDDMEALGIYEVIEEDLALCEFIDVSKHEVQAIVREGIDLMINS